MERRPAAPSQNAGRRLHAPVGASHSSGPSALGRYAVGTRSVSRVQNDVSRIPSGSKIRVRSTSSNGCPAARSNSTERTLAPVLYSQRSPGCAINGSVPSRAIHVSGSGFASGSGGPSVLRTSSSAAVTIGHGGGEANIRISIPNPNVNVSRSRATIGRQASVVRFSGPSMRMSTGGRSAREAAVSTGLLERQQPLLHERHRRGRRDRLAGRRDPEQRVTRHRRATKRS